MDKCLIVFLAPSGSGKSTCAIYLKNYFRAKVLKLALPLYKFQTYIYQELNISITGQDGELLQFLGEKIDKIAPNFLFEEFKKMYDPSEGIIVNDDCRPQNYEKLKALGAIFIKITGPQRHRTEDPTPQNSKSILEWQEPIPCNYEIKNTQDLNHLYQQIDDVMEKLCLKKFI